jgi:hypothetical protein
MYRQLEDPTGEFSFRENPQPKIGWPGAYIVGFLTLVSARERKAPSIPLYDRPDGLRLPDALKIMPPAHWNH